MCYLFLGVRCGFPFKEIRLVCLFKQNKKKAYLKNKSPTPNSIPIKHVHDHRSALHLYNTQRSMPIP
jgi:hypothetical protein